LNLNGFIHYTGAFLIIDLALKASSSVGLIEKILTVDGEERPTIGSKEWLRELPISDEQDKYYVGVILYYITTIKGKLYDRA